MGVEDGAGAQVSHRLNDVLGDENAFGNAGGGKALVEQQQAVASRDLKDLGQAPAFFTQSAQVNGVVLVGGEVGIDIVAGADARRARRDIDAPLCHQHGDTDRLGKDGFAAAVRAGEDIDAMFIAEFKVVGNDVDVLTAHFIDGKFQVVYVGKVAPALLGIEDLRLTQRHSGRADLFDQLRPAVIEQDLGHQADQRIAADIDVFFYLGFDILDGAPHDLGDLLAHRVRQRIFTGDVVGVDVYIVGGGFDNDHTRADL